MWKVLEVELARVVDERLGRVRSLVVEEDVVLEGRVEAAGRAERPPERVVHRARSVLSERIHHP